MADPDDLDARLRNVEREVEGLKTENKELRRDVSAARVLAAGADQDVSNMHAAFRAQTMILNAMRETQLEHGKRIGGLEQRMDGLEQRMDGLDQRMDGLESEMRTGFATMAAGMQQITTLLTTALDDGSFGPGRNRPGNT